MKTKNTSSYKTLNVTFQTMGKKKNYNHGFSHTQKSQPDQVSARIIFIKFCNSKASATEDTVKHTPG